MPHATAQRTGADESTHKVLACDTSLQAPYGTTSSSKTLPTTLFLILYSYLSTNVSSISLSTGSDSTGITVRTVLLNKTPPKESCPQTSPPILCKCPLQCKQNYCCATRAAATQSEKESPHVMNLQGSFSDYD